MDYHPVHYRPDNRLLCELRHCRPVLKTRKKIPGSNSEPPRELLSEVTSEHAQQSATVFSITLKLFSARETSRD
jgi:hypothetical protein